MLTSLSFIFLLGLAMAAVCQRLKLPRIIGMLLTGILLGALCAESAGSFHIGCIGRPAPDGSDHYFAKGRIVA